MVGDELAGEGERVGALRERSADRAVEPGERLVGMLQYEIVQRREEEVRTPLPGRGRQQQFEERGVVGHSEAQRPVEGQVGAFDLGELGEPAGQAVGVHGPGDYDEHRPVGWPS